VTSTPIEVDDWLSAKTFKHPTMTASLGMPVPDALALVVSALTAHGYKVKDAGPTGFRATWWDRTGLLGVLAATDWDFKRTRLAVTAAAVGAETRLTVQVERGAEHRAGRRKGREALTAAFQDAQRRGIAVTTTPWVKP
jgi:hypothetical protein